MVYFESREDVERWLKGEPREVATLIAARAVLRVVPTLSTVFGQPKFRAREIGQDIVLPVMRAVATAWVAARYPRRQAEIRSACNSSRDAADAAARVAAASLDPRNSSADPDAAAYAAARAAGIGAVGLDSEVRVLAARAIAAAGNLYAVSDDADALKTQMSFTDLASAELWPRGVPTVAVSNWARLRAALRQLDEGWEVWTSWYETRRNGSAAHETLEVARVLIADELWRDGPKAVNTEIKRMIQEQERDEEREIFESAFTEAASEWDFFLSYSGPDETFARWVSALLDAAGLRVFVQFNDIPAGSQFVREMQRGLEQSSRFIALQSPNYVKSDHCQAEWSAAYASDPGGQARKLIQFLIQPTELPPLARTIVYKSLVGLSPAEAASTILQAIGYEGPGPEIPPGWPGSVAIDSIHAATGGIYDVAPTTSGLLERQQIAFNPRGEAGFTPQQVFDHLAREISEFADYTKRRKGNFSYSDRIKDRAERLRETTDHGLLDCDALTLNKQLTWMLRVIAYDQREGLIPDNDEIESYRADLFGYYNKLEHIFPQLKVYRQMDARQRFTSPTPEVEQAIDAIYGALGDPKVTADVLSPKLSEELKDAGEDIGKAKQLDESKPSEDTRDVTVESHTNAATRSLAVWNWLANASDKFAKSGKKVEDIHKTVESYEKLYGKLSPQMQTYLGYLLKWFF